jgi:hypothetical protein
MDTWDPCANEDYFTALRADANPEFISDFNFKSPFAEYASIIPGNGTSNRKEVCIQDPSTGTWRLANGWELFHRYLATADYDGNLNYPPAFDPVGGLAKTAVVSIGVIPQTSHRLPYFSLYHKATGNLRTFIWRSSMVPIDGNMLGIAEEVGSPFHGTIRDGLRSTIRNGFSMEGSGYSMAIPLAQMWDYTPRSEMHWYNISQSSGFWIVLDRSLSYDPWSAFLDPDLLEEPDMSEGEKFSFGQRQDLLMFNLIGVEKSDIQLKGEMVPESSTDVVGGLGIFANHSWASGLLRSAAESGVGYLKENSTSITKTITEKDNSDAVPAGECDSDDKKAVVKELSTFETALNLGTNLALGNVGAVSGFVFDNIFGKRVTFQKQKIELTGYIETKNPNGTFDLPISPYSLYSRPYYFKYDAKTDQPVHSGNIGLFNFYVPPKLLIHRIDETIWLTENSRQELSHYYLTVEDPTCELVVNPEAGVELQSILVMPLYNKGGRENPKWEAVGELTDFKPLSSMERVYWMSHINSDIFTPSTENVALLVAVQFKETKSGQLILHQRMFMPDMEFTKADYGDRKNDGEKAQRYLSALKMPRTQPLCTYDPATGRAKESKDGPPRRYMYDVAITTGTTNHNGSDGTFKLSMQGCDGFEEEVPLNYTGENPFETGRTGYFKKLTPISNDPLRRFQIRLQPKGSHPEWELDQIQITHTDVFTGKRKTLVDYSPGSLWLNGTNQSPAGDWVYTYNIPGSDATCADYAEAVGNTGLADYTIEMSTQNFSDGASNAAMEIELCGKVALKTSDGFEPGEETCWTDTFQKDLLAGGTTTFTAQKVHFATLTSLRVKNKGNDWLAKDIVVKQSAGGATSSQTFAIRRWLEQSDEVTRKAGVGTALDFLVTTDAFDGSGSAADFVAELTGSKGTAMFWWDNAGQDDFESSKPSTFLFYVEKDLGKIETLKIYRDNSGYDGGWLAGTVTLTAKDLATEASNDVYRFTFHEWLDVEGLYDLRTEERTKVLTFKDVEGRDLALGLGGFSFYRNADAEMKTELALSTASLTSGSGTGGVSQVIAFDGEGNKHYLIPQYLADDGFPAGSLKNFTTYRDIKGGIERLRIVSKKNDDWMIDYTNVKVYDATSNELVSSCNVSWNNWLTSSHKIDTEDKYFNDGSFVYMERQCDNWSAQSKAIQALKKTGAAVLAGERITLSGRGLDANADSWVASLGSNEMPVSGVSYNTITLEVPRSVRSGNYTLTVSNAASGIAWNQNVQLENPAPVLTAISHTVRKPGEVLEFKGSQFGSFSDAIAVTIGGQPANLLRLLDDRISVLVPDLAPGNHQVLVSVFGKTAAQVYTISVPAVYPELTGLSPRITLPGKLVTVYGKYFGTDAALAKVYLGERELVPASLGTGKLTFKVPEDMAYGDWKVKVSVRGYMAKTSLDLTLGGPPEVFSFDDPDLQWTCNEAPVIRDVTVTNGSRASMALGGSGYRVARSPRFNTDLIGEYSDTIAVDVYIPNGLSNPYWAGEIAMFLDLPAAGLNNSWVGNAQLTGLSTGAWHTLRFPLGDAQLAAIAGDYPGLQVALVLNAASAESYYRFDNLRFVGSNKQYRIGRHVVGSRLLNVLVPDALGFEAASPWTAESGAALQYVTEPREQGAHALKVNSSGYTSLKSLPVRSWEWKAATGLLNVEVYIPDPAPNPWWVGNVSVALSCPEDGINNRYLGQKDLTHLFRMEYNSVQIPLSADLLAQLHGLTGSCQVQVALNVASGSAPFVLDKMGFVANAGASLPSSSSSATGSSSSQGNSGTGAGASFQCTGMCAAAVAASTANQTYTLGSTGDVWYVMDRIPAGWQGSEMAGRTLEVNGVAVAMGATGWPAASGAKWYVHFSAGTHSWASWSWWP